MKRIIITGIIIMAVAAGCKTFLDNLTAVPKDYYAKVQSDGPLEAKYTRMGNYAVATKLFPVHAKAFQNIKIWYPAELENSKKQYPAVIFANGTGVPYTKYEPLFEHLASWGFIAVGNDEKNSWAGLGASQSLELLLSMNGDTGSILHNKVNTGQIGLSGHSQGGVAVINAVTTQKGGSIFRSAYGASTTKHELSVGLQWPYDVSKIKIPYFAVAGMGASDAGDGKDKKSGIAPLWSMIENLNKLPSSSPAIIARRKDAFHEHMLYKADGYMTAWFLYTLTHDSEAKKAFAGSNPEIRQNSNWQDIEIRNIR